MSARLFLCIGASLALFPCQADNLENHWTGIPYFSHSSRIKALQGKEASCSSLVNAILYKEHKLDCGSSDFRTIKRKFTPKLQKVNVSNLTPQVWISPTHFAYIYPTENTLQALHSPFEASRIEPPSSLLQSDHWQTILLSDLKTLCRPVASQ